LRVIRLELGEGGEAFELEAVGGELLEGGSSFTTRQRATEAATRRERRTDWMKGKLKPLVRFGTFEIFNEGAWQAAKEI
jgi:hypothetical protein